MGGEDLVLRLCDHGAEVLGIDRSTEEIASRRAAAERIAPAVVAFLSDVPALVTRWLPGGDVAVEQCARPASWPRSPGCCAGCTPRRRSPARSRSSGSSRSSARSPAPCPTATSGLLALLHRIEAALTGPEHVPVSCHNDLLTANFVRDGARVCIVDWEYAGMNNRYFDLGNLSVNNGFEDDDDRALLELYFEEPVTEARFAALQLLRIVSDFREAMWGAVQLRRSELDFDYAAYADEHFERLERAAADPRVEEWLAVAATA